MGACSRQPSSRHNSELAVFATNGPISAAPANFLWFLEAKIEFAR